MDISVESLAAIQQEIAEGGAPVDLGINWDDVPFDDDSKIIGEL